MLQGGAGLGAEVKNIGSGFSAQSLTDKAFSVRAATFGAGDINKNWKIFPTLLTQYSKNRFRTGDEIYFATLDLEAARRFTQNFELKFQATYQYDNIKAPTGPGASTRVTGNYYKFTIAPTLKLDTSGGFFKRPEVRLLASYINFSNAFENFRIPKNAPIDQLGFGNAFPDFRGTGGGQFVLGIQSEVFF